MTYREPASLVQVMDDIYTNSIHTEDLIESSPSISGISFTDIDYSTASDDGGEGNVVDVVSNWVNSLSEFWAGLPSTREAFEAIKSPNLATTIFAPIKIGYETLSSFLANPQEFISNFVDEVVGWIDGLGMYWNDLPTPSELAENATLQDRIFSHIKFYWEGFSDFIINIPDNIVAGLGLLSDFVNDLGETIIDGISDFGAWLSEGVGNVWTWITSNVNDLGELIGEALGDAWESTVEFFSNTVNGIITGILTWWDDLPSTFTEFAALESPDGWTRLVSLLKIGYTHLEPFLRDPIGFVTRGLGEVWTTITTFFDDASMAIQEALGDAWMRVTTFFDDTTTAIQNALGDTWTTITTFFDDVGAGVTRALGDTWTSITSFFENPIERIIEFGSELGGIITEWWNRLPAYNPNSPPTDPLTRIMSTIKGVEGTLSPFLRNILSILSPPSGTNFWVHVYNNTIGAIPTTATGFIASLGRAVETDVTASTPTLNDYLDSFIGFITGRGVIQTAQAEEISNTAVNTALSSVNRSEDGTLRDNFDVTNLWTDNLYIKREGTNRSGIRLFVEHEGDREGALQVATGPTPYILVNSDGTIPTPNISRISRSLTFNNVTTRLTAENTLYNRFTFMTANTRALRVYFNGKESGLGVSSLSLENPQSNITNKGTIFVNNSGDLQYVYNNVTQTIASIGGSSETDTLEGEISETFTTFAGNLGVGGGNNWRDRIITASTNLGTRLTALESRPSSTSISASVLSVWQSFARTLSVESNENVNTLATNVGTRIAQRLSDLSTSIRNIDIPEPQDVNAPVETVLEEFRSEFGVSENNSIRTLSRNIAAEISSQISELGGRITDAIPQMNSITSNAVASAFNDIRRELSLPRVADESLNELSRRIGENLQSRLVAGERERNRTASEFYQSVFGVQRPTSLSNTQAFDNAGDRIIELINGVNNRINEMNNTSNDLAFWTRFALSSGIDVSTNDDILAIACNVGTHIRTQLNLLQISGGGGSGGVSGTIIQTILNNITRIFARLGVVENTIVQRGITEASLLEILGEFRTGLELPAPTISDPNTSQLISHLGRQIKSRIDRLERLGIGFNPSQISQVLQWTGNISNNDTGVYMSNNIFHVNANRLQVNGNRTTTVYTDRVSLPDRSTRGYGVLHVSNGVLQFSPGSVQGSVNNSVSMVTTRELENVISRLGTSIGAGGLTGNSEALATAVGAHLNTRLGEGGGGGANITSLTTPISWGDDLEIPTDRRNIVFSDSNFYVIGNSLRVRDSGNSPKQAQLQSTGLQLTSRSNNQVGNLYILNGQLEYQFGDEPARTISRNVGNLLENLRTPISWAQNSTTPTDPRNIFFNNRSVFYVNGAALYLEHNTSRNIRKRSILSPTRLEITDTDTNTTRMGALRVRSGVLEYSYPGRSTTPLAGDPARNPPTGNDFRTALVNIASGLGISEGSKSTAQLSQDIGQALMSIRSSGSSSSGTAPTSTGTQIQVLTNSLYSSVSNIRQRRTSHFDDEVGNSRGQIAVLSDRENPNSIYLIIRGTWYWFIFSLSDSLVSPANESHTTSTIRNTIGYYQQDSHNNPTRFVNRNPTGAIGFHQQSNDRDDGSLYIVRSVVRGVRTIVYTYKNDDTNGRTTRNSGVANFTIPIASGGQTNNAGLLDTNFGLAAGSIVYSPDHGRLYVRYGTRWYYRPFAFSTTIS